jgi:hypothetical protein
MAGEEFVLSGLAKRFAFVTGRFPLFDFNADDTGLRIRGNDKRGGRENGCERSGCEA